MKKWKLTTLGLLASIALTPTLAARAQDVGAAAAVAPAAPAKNIFSMFCMTPEQVNDDKLPSMMHEREESCTSKVLNQTASSVTAEATCHGRMEGVGHFQISWRGNEHYEGTYNFNGTMEGRPQNISTRYSGDFVKADCGALKPAPVMSH